MNPAIEFWNWLLYARIGNGFSSHWSANLLLIIPGLLIFYKLIRFRMGSVTSSKRALFWMKLIAFLALDAFFIAYFPGSLHEVIFEPLFVAVTVLTGQNTIAQYAHNWAIDLNIWRSLYIEWSTTTILGFGWFIRAKVMQFKWRWWIPFMVVIVVWSAYGLPVSLPFPFENSPYCHDCFSTNFAEFMYNVTFAIGIVPSFKGQLITKAQWIRMRDSQYFLWPLGVGLTLLLMYLVFATSV